jgi:hypothetical protein
MDDERLLFSQLNHGNVLALTALAHVGLKDSLGGADIALNETTFGHGKLVLAPHERAQRRDTDATLVDTDAAVEDDDTITVSSNATLASADADLTSPSEGMKWSGVGGQFYPDDSNLPWNTSFVDAFVGGMSAPTERCNWKAMHRLNVGLVVNLTESCIHPSHVRGNRCMYI